MSLTDRQPLAAPPAAPSGQGVDFTLGTANLAVGLGPRMSAFEKGFGCRPTINGGRGLGAASEGIHNSRLLPSSIGRPCRVGRTPPFSEALGVRTERSMLGWVGGRALFSK